jgi:lysylphosphatidylglycerol synthetase-like protein (DUF2156 family)
MNRNDSQSTPQEKKVARTAAWILAAAPYLFLQLVYMSRPDEWEYVACYGANVVFIPAVVIIWSICMILEWRIRSESFSERHLRAPWFSIFGLVFLIIFQLFRPLRYPVNFTEQKSRFIGIVWMIVLLFSFACIARQTLPIRAKKEPNKTNGE